MKKAIVLLGPTASGKTKVSVELAKKIEGEIVSADSMQIYRHMDIGTAKPTSDEMQGIKHYLIDVVEPWENFSVAQYKEKALACIREIVDKGKVPIVCGGTGLYLNSLIYNIEYAEMSVDAKLRESLKKTADEKGNKYLHDELCKIDPEAADKIHENNVKRVIRALEVYKAANETISKQQAMSRNKPPEYDFRIFGLNCERKKLYSRIDERVDEMFSAGLVEEVEKLKISLNNRGQGLNGLILSMQGIGYKEVLRYLSGELSLEETKELIKKSTRNYAKRQMTWFRKIENVNWIDIEGKDAVDMAEEIAANCKILR